MKNKIPAINRDTCGAANSRCLGAFLFCLLLFHSMFLHAQSKTTNGLQRTNVIYSGNHFGLQLGFLHTSKARVKPLTQGHPLGASAMPGIQAAFNYHINMGRHHSINTGLEATLAGRNFNLVLLKNDFSPPLKYDYFLTGIKTITPNLIISMPVSFEKRLYYKNNKSLKVEAGIRLNFSPGADFDIDMVHVESTDGNFIPILEIDKYTNNDLKPWVSGLFSFGHCWLLKNNNIFSASFVSNLSFTKYVDGHYFIDIPGKPQGHGRYSATGTFWGVSLGYLFTNGNYRLRKKYEKQVLKARQ